MLGSLVPLIGVGCAHAFLEDYEFAPQHALDKAPAGVLGLYASTMKLQVRLLHEEDLTRLLGDLRRQARALIQVRRCVVARLPRTGADNALQGLLQAGLYARIRALCVHSRGQFNGVFGAGHGGWSCGVR